MPSSAELLRVATTIAHELSWLAMGWHLLILVLVTLLAAGWRPSERLCLLLLVVPALSVAIGSFMYESPFNGLTFGVLAAALAVLGGGARNDPAKLGPTWAVAIGVALVMFGWCYPHFNTVPWFRTLYAAPIGVLPCPTLAVLAGFTLLGRGFGSRTVPVLLGAFDAFYGVFGILRFGVVLDVGLLFAAMSLVVLMIQNVRVGRSSPFQVA